MTYPADILEALNSGDHRKLQAALDRAVPPNIRRAYAAGEEARLAGFPIGTCPLEGDEAIAWGAGWRSLTPIVDPMREATKQDMAEHRDPHEGTVE